MKAWIVLTLVLLAAPNVFAEDVRIFYSDAAFSSGKTMAKAGDRVTFYNQSKTPHYFQSIKPGCEFKTPLLKYQENYTVVFFKGCVTTVGCPEHPKVKVNLIIQPKTID